MLCSPPIASRSSILSQPVTGRAAQVEQAVRDHPVAARVYDALWPHAYTGMTQCYPRGPATGPTGEVAGPPLKTLERSNPPQITNDSIEQLLSALKT